MAHSLRQRQFVAKLMRGIDPGPIQSALDSADDAARQDAARFRRAERWRDRLVAGGDPAITEFAAEFPDCDREEAARLVDAVLAERKAGKAAGAGRKLFRWVQDALAAAR